MGAYIIRRLLFLAPLLLVGSMLVFIVLRVAPGDPVNLVLGPNSTAEERQELRDSLGLNDPLPVQYVRWTGDLVTFNLGDSVISSQPIGGQILSRLPPTLEIWVLSLVLTTLMGVAFGVLSAVFRDTLLDYAVRFFSVAFLSIPGFFALTLLIVVPSLLWNYVPPLRYASPAQELGGEPPDVPAPCVHSFVGGRGRPYAADPVGMS